MADDTVAFLEAVVGGPARLVGHSDGAFVAMLVGMQRPDLVDRLVMISGGFNTSGEAAIISPSSRRRSARWRRESPTSTSPR